MAPRKKSQDGTNLTSGQQYKLVCSGRFDKIDKELSENTAALKEHSSIVTVIQGHSDILNRHTDTIRRMENKVFNGFGDRINGMDVRMGDLAIEFRNTTKQLQKNIDNAQKEIHAIAKFGATALVMIFVALLGILGSIWVQDYSNEESTVGAVTYEITNTDESIKTE